LDPDYAAAFLETIAQLELSSSGVVRCEVVPLKLREHRGTGVLLFRFQTPAGAAGALRAVELVGKVTSGRRGTPSGQKAFAFLRTLRENGFSQGPLLVPRPIAYWPASRLMLVSLAPGADLMTLFKAGDETLPQAVQLAGRWVGKLHTLAIMGPPARSLERQASKVNQVASQVKGAHPSLAPRTARVRRQILQKIMSADPASFVPCHGDFLPKNVVFDKGTLTAIDFEECGLFDPAKDVGKFLGNLEVKADIYPVPFDVPHLQRQFLDAYLEAAGHADWGRIAAYHALGLLKHARRQRTARDAEVWLDAAEAVIEEAGT
jgi:thiamine kinase-like enzyme